MNKFLEKQHLFGMFIDERAALAYLMHVLRHEVKQLQGVCVHQALHQPGSQMSTILPL